MDGALDQGAEPLRLKLVEASVLQRLGENETAAELLFAAWTGYALAGAPHEAVLALLDLAALRTEQGAAEDLERLLQGLQSLPGLEEKLRERDLAGLTQAIERGGLEAVEKLEVLKLLVEWTRCDPAPGLRFSPAGNQEDLSQLEGPPAARPVEGGEGA